MPHPSTVPLNDYLSDLLSQVRFADLQLADVLSINLSCGAGTPTLQVTPKKLQFLAEDGGPPPEESLTATGRHWVLIRNSVRFSAFEAQS